MAITLSTSQFNRTIDINSSSAMAKANAYFQLKDLVSKTVTESAFKTAFEKFLEASGEANSSSLGDMAAEVVGVINSLYPSKIDSAKTDSKNAANYFIALSEDIAADIYPKWEVRLVVNRYKTSDGNYVDIPVGGVVTGKYTPTGQKITM